MPELREPTHDPSIAPDLASLTRLERSFYSQPVLRVARELCGALIVRECSEGVLVARIVETEAYRGPEDLASHTARGRRTHRTRAMWGPGGHAYMFMLYGSSWAFNVVTGDEGEPHAVLVRAVEPLVGLESMSERRRIACGRRELTNGPGKLCMALGLDGADYGADLVLGAGLWLAADPLAPRVRVGRSARINVDYAGSWARRPWRFFIRGNRYVSVPPRD